MKPAESNPVNEILDVVDEKDRVIGQASRQEVHGNPALLHRVVHVLVFDSRGRLFLQKRADDRVVQPGKWDTSMGGHVDAGENPEEAAHRELSEELGIPESTRLQFLHKYKHSNDYESELVTTWITLWDGPFHLQKSEISEGRFWELEEIDLLSATPENPGPFTPNFLEELRRWRERRV
ncbi:MAG: NUDIX domain-containing protein [Spirochaetaceae bacterium]|nr:NUDIX domain-containing protein [Spirochaetaceae bacterium]